jgi:hypothetical protein
VSFSCSYALYRKTNETSDGKLSIGVTDKSSDNDENIYKENVTNNYIMEDSNLYSTNDMEDSESDKTLDAVNALSDIYNKDTGDSDNTSTTEDNNDSSDIQISNRKNYIVREFNGYVAVFTISNSLYEFTDIVVDELDSDLKKRVKNGILFEKEEELYTFLESCSS